MRSVDHPLAARQPQDPDEEPGCEGRFRPAHQLIWLVSSGQASTHVPAKVTVTSES
ncbi:MAG: hypothetical protein ABSG93_18080 [Solirubrobacteraceae bacterium]